MATSSNSDLTNTQKEKESPQLSRPLRSKSFVRSEQITNRLPSLRGPRDLTLGGVKRKTFTPNIPVRREKNKVEAKEDAKPKKEIKSKRDRSLRGGQNRERGRGGFQKAEIIQSHSIFESGPSAEAVDHGRGPKLNAGGLTSNQMQKPTIHKEKRDIDIHQEKMESDAAMRKLEDGNTAFVTGVTNDERLKPTTLPLFTEAMGSVKQETGGSSQQLKIPHPLNCSQIFSDQQKLILLQLPDSVPGVPLSTSSAREETGVSTKTEVTEDTKELSQKCSLDNLSSGRIGKLQILKSGKCRLVLGSVTLNMRMGTTSSFAEEIVSVRLPPEGSPDSSTGHMTVLGNVDHKLICTPDMEMLLR